ncbi:hypothetical protein PsorP6_010714 [Peronosclerospora sorghi]|uniref:Uncharacterized protein n=1 Tax=Peronosclerospora sorghi TaxID=230839 RepID=A0ACC0VYE5_9STRA|nr:hypothetical protein PsorP6_010714 [Peronosclerospora sorghi]
MDPRSAYMEMVSLDKKLRDLLHANPLNTQDANEVRHRLMNAATRLADTYPVFSVSKEVELALWKPCFYRRIEDFRRRIRKYAITAQADRNLREHFARLSSEFQQFLSEATDFYMHLRDVFARWLQQNGGTTKESDTTLFRQSLHRCYVFLGDLARYRELHSQKAKKNFAAAEALYYRALAVVPENGNPHNQLAVLATYIEAETVAVYRYCRSLLTSQPFTTAEENLALLFERSRQRPLAAPITFTTSSPSSKEKSAFLKSFLHRLTRMHGILFALSPTALSEGSERNEGTALAYPRDMEAVLMKDLQTLLHAGVIGDALLLKIVVTNIFCLIRTNASRSQSAPMVDAMRLSIRTITSVMEFILDGLNLKLKKGLSSKSPKDLTLASLRLLGPVVVFCEYLEQHPNMLEKLEQLVLHGPKTLNSDVATDGQDARLSHFACFFLETLVKLVNHARLRELYTPLISSTGEPHEHAREEQYLLKEKLELRGFQPLEKSGVVSTWQDEWALQTPATGSNAASQVTPLSDDKAAKLRAWSLYHFAQYLCDGYESNPLLFCSASGQFTTSPMTGNKASVQIKAQSDGLASLDFEFLSTGNAKQKQTLAQDAFDNKYGAAGGDDDEFDDELILFRPSSAFKRIAEDQPPKNNNYLTATMSAGSGVFSMQAPSPISQVGNDGRTSQTSALGASTSSFGSSLGYPSFKTFNDGGRFSSESTLSPWGKSANCNGHSSNDNTLQSNLCLDLGMSFPGSSGLNTGLMTSASIFSETRGSQDFEFGSRGNETHRFDPMADLAAVERESALYQQRTSSLSVFLSTPTQTKTPSPSFSRLPTRPPPGFAVASTEEQQQSSAKPFIKP